MEDVEGACVYSCVGDFFVDGSTCSPCTVCIEYAAMCSASLDALCDTCGEFEQAVVGDDHTLECQLPSTCQGYHDQGDRGMGVRTVSTQNFGQLNVYCDNSNGGGGWMLVRYE